MAGSTRRLRAINCLHSTRQRYAWKQGVIKVAVDANPMEEEEEEEGEEDLQPVLGFPLTGP